MAAEHPLGEARICGSQLKYLASWSGGYIGAFCFSCFSCSALKLGDQRLSERLVRIASEKGLNPSGSYPQAAGGDKLAMKVYYGFLSNENDEISFQRILSGHRTTSIRRSNSYSTVVAVQDTTDLNFSGLLKTTGLGKSGKGKGASVLMLHSLFLVGGDGLPLGIPFAECTAPSILGRNGHERNRTPIEEKESGRWLSFYRETLEISGKCPRTRIVRCPNLRDFSVALFCHFQPQRGYVI